MPPTIPATPTPAAMRAAQKALSARAKTKHSNGHLILREIAAIIDRETGLPELVAACEAALEFVEHGKNPAAGCVAAPAGDVATVQMLRAALAKATGSVLICRKLALWSAKWNAIDD